jgi:NAD(P)-dependent dehydrogenase (short-subunit alcohol dehydrogenase family)
MAYKSSGPIDCSIDPDTSNLKGRTAIVTGGASGIGLAYVRHLTKAGAYVVIADVNEEGGKKVQEETGKNSVFVKCDVRKWSDQLAVFKKAIELSPEGQIDIVVANAGVAANDILLENDVSTDEPAEPEFRTVDVNLHGVLYTTKLALWYFQKQQAQLGEGKGRDRNLVLQASVAGYLDLPGPSYGVSKFGVRGLMRCLRQTVSVHGIRVNLIAPW